MTPGRRTEEAVEGFRVVGGHGTVDEGTGYH